jgi:hypothetical protein
MLTPYIMTKTLAESDGQGLMTSEGCDLNINTQITLPETKMYVLSTHPAVENTTVNSRQTFFSEPISQGYSDTPYICNTVDIQRVQQTHQQQQMAVCPSEHDKQTFLSPSASVTLPRNRKTAIKIPRPPNAFILFSNERRKKVADQYPWENNTEVSKRLGAMWKSMSSEEKSVYMALACDANAKHKKEHPDYVYSPIEARIRKALRAKGHDRGACTRRPTAALPATSARQQAAQYQQCGTTHHQALQ